MADVIGAVALIGLAVVANTAMLLFQSLALFHRVAHARIPRLVVGLLELAAFGLILLRMVAELAPTLIGWGMPAMHLAWFIEIAAFPGSDQITFIATLIVLTVQGMRLGYAGYQGSEEDARRRGSLLIAVMVVVIVLALLFMQFLVWPQAQSLARQSDTHLVAYDIRTGERQFEHWFVSLDDPLRPPSVPAPQRNNRYPATGIMFHEGKWLWCDVGGEVHAAQLPP